VISLYLVWPNQNPHVVSKQKIAVFGNETNSSTNTTNNDAFLASQTNSKTTTTNYSDEHGVSAEKATQFREWVENKNGLIDFFGKVIDQDKNPVSGVKIRISIRQ